MDALYKIKDMLCTEIEDIVAQTKGKALSESMVSYIDKVTHALKSVTTILAMEEADGGSYGKRDSRGRYMTRRYMGDDVRDKISEMMQNADQSTRRILEDTLRQL